MYGIDVAKWQGTIDWAKVKKAGKQFAILKVTQKDNAVEGAFEKNYAGCIANGLPVGVYRYVYAKTVAAAQAEANAIVKILKGKNIKCGVWLDMEDASIKGIGRAKLTEIIKAEAAIIKAAGFKVGIYCNKDWYNNVLDGPGLAKTYPFWIARYPATDNGTVKESLSPKAYANAWQYSSKGAVPGIAGNVDLNLAFVDLVQLMSGSEAKQEAPKSNATVYYPKYTGTSTSIVAALQSLKIDSSYSSRIKIAKANNIKGYSGTVEQNTAMLNLLKQGKLKKA